MDETIVDIEAELEDLLVKIQPELQNVIKRGFTNSVIQLSKNGKKQHGVPLPDVSHSSKSTQIELFSLEILKEPFFHVQNVLLDVKALQLSLICSLGEVNVRGLYRAINDEMYNVIPVSSDGHITIDLINVIADINVGLSIKEDSFVVINPNVTFSHDEVALRLTWPSPKKTGGYEFITSEKYGKNADDISPVAAVSHQVHAVLRKRLLEHLSLVLKNTTDISEMLGSSPDLNEAYNTKVSLLAEHSNKALDVILINVRKTLFIAKNEMLNLPAFSANFTQKVGSISFVGKFETSEGWIKNLATIDRINDVSVQPGLTKTTFCASLAFRNLQIGFDDYHIKVMSFGPSGRILVSIGENLVYLAMTTGINHWTNYAEINELRVVYFEWSEIPREIWYLEMLLYVSLIFCTEKDVKRTLKLDIHITGLGPLNWLVSRLATWLSGYAHTLVIPRVEQQLKEEFCKAFNTISVWNLIKGKFPT